MGPVNGKDKIDKTQGNDKESKNNKKGFNLNIVLMVKI